MKKNTITTLREISRKLVRELGMLQLNTPHLKKTPQHWPALIEIEKEPGITPSKVGNLLILSISATSRIVNALINHGLVAFQEGMDKREKHLHITEKGRLEVASIDEFSNNKIKGAFEFLTEDEQEKLITAIQKYGAALEKSRLMREQVKIHTLSTSRAIRKQIVQMIEHIQKKEFLLPITDDVNAGILRAENEFYFHNSYNFWYAVDNQGAVIGSIGLKKIDEHQGQIKKFFVAQSYRGKGVAQKLMNTLIKAASKHHFDSLYLGTVGTLQAAQGFYKKVGFSEISQQQLPASFNVCPIDTVFFIVKVEDLQNRLSHFP
ncbi:MAG: MarR family transcriptional regulator [Alphaproteobacteria bacterium]|nr:MarR family transcriptional regulator [Alphaproteobacteria bacterium]